MCGFTRSDELLLCCLHCIVTRPYLPLQMTPLVQQQASQLAAQQAAPRVKARRAWQQQQQQRQQQQVAAKPLALKDLQRSLLMKKPNCAALQCSSSSWSLLQCGVCA
jgi:hypothetical protein